jgi:hypothetical protein
MPDLKFAKPKEPKTSDGKISARTRNEPQRRNGVVLSFDLRPNISVNEIQVKPIHRPNRKVTAEIREELSAKICEINDVVHTRRILEAQLSQLNADFNRKLQEILDLGPFDAKELQDLSHEAFKALRLYR